MNLSVSMLCLQRAIMAYALAQRTHTYSFSSLALSFSLPAALSLPPASTQTGHCVRAQMRFACMLDWITHAGSGNLDPCGLPSLFGAWNRHSSSFNLQLQTISQLNWLRNIQNQRLNSYIWESGRQTFRVSSQLPDGICLKINFTQTPHPVLHPSAVRFITWGDKSVRKG